MQKIVGEEKNYPGCNILLVAATKQEKTLSQDFYKLSILPYAGIIIKICRAYTHSQEDFEDYYQEVCLQIWRSKDNFKKESEWATWVYRIALNVCLTLVKKKRITTESYNINTLKSSQYDKHSSSNKEAIDALYAAIKKLSEVDRAVIILYLEEKSYQEIANIMGTNPTNIGVRINRIKKRLKNILL